MFMMREGWDMNAGKWKGNYGQGFYRPNGEKKPENYLNPSHSIPVFTWGVHLKNEETVSSG